MGDIQYVCKSNILRHLHVGISIPSLLKECYTLEGLNSRSLVYKNLEHFNHIDMVIIRMTQYNRAWLQFKCCLKFAHFRPYHHGLPPQHFVNSSMLSWEKNEGRKVNIA